MTVKEKKEILKSFSEIEGRVRELEEEHEALWSNATSAPMNTNGEPRGVSSNKIETAIERMEELIILIDQERDELESVKHRVMKAIRKLPRITERRIIQLKYIGKAEDKYHRTMTLWQIAKELNYSVDWIKHLHSDALRQLEF